METADVYRALWRHKFFILIFTACVVAGTWVLTERQQPVYETGTLIRVLQRIEDPSETGGALETGERLARTYANITETYNIAERISEETGGIVPAGEIDISAAPVRDLELLWISARSPDPETAQLVANAAPRALQSFIRETGTPGDSVITVERAGLPSQPASPNLKLNLALALLLGIIFNGALALLIEVLGDRVHDADELERLTGLPVLTTIPVLQFTKPSQLFQQEGPSERASEPVADEDGRRLAHS